MKPAITAHTIIKNEDRWIWYAIKSVINFVDRLLIYDTGSTDSTLKLIRSISSKKIILKQTPASTREDLVQLRNRQIKKTKTPWLMLLDGDEVWPQRNLQKLVGAIATAPKNTLAFYTSTRNCVGDIYHYLPQSKGRYRIKDHTGHLNIRLIKNIPGLKVTGSYPLEAYTYKGAPIQQLDSLLKFVDTWYLHATHLPRSTKAQSEGTVIDRPQKRKWRLGLKMTQSDLPQVLFAPRPDFVPKPPTHRWIELLKSIARR